MADRMHDENSKRIMLDIASGYDELAAWTAKSDTAEAECAKPRP